MKSNSIKLALNDEMGFRRILIVDLQDILRTGAHHTHTVDQGLKRDTPALWPDGPCKLQIRARGTIVCGSGLALTERNDGDVHEQVERLRCGHVLGQFV